jgi:uncharacterized membrane protein YeiB
MRLLAEILVAYGIYALATFLLIARQGKKDRLPSVIVAWVMPIVALLSFITTTIRLVLRRPMPMRPCPEGLEDAERLIAAKRQEMFGGPLKEPHVAAQWSQYYSLALELEAVRIQNLARKFWKPHFNVHKTA